MMRVRYVSHIPRDVRKLASYQGDGYTLTIFRNGSAYYALLDVGNELYNLAMKVHAEGPEKALSIFFAELGFLPIKKNEGGDINEL
ncbi:MAG: hypothetical protein J7L91_02715 [Candidatus Korarchaeota archaeon]|nr:hypothetical protein [Candidatus Korarchaeota archaeon]